MTHEFTQVSSSENHSEPGEGHEVVLAADGTIFPANGQDGLRAYTFDGSTFTGIAHIDDGGSANCVTLSAAGTIFLTTGNDGLRAYTYIGTSFTNTAHIDDIGEWNTSKDVEVAPGGSVFLADRGQLSAYSFDGVSFTNTTKINANDWLQAIAVGADNTVFLANISSMVTSGSLQAYRFEWLSFTKTAHGQNGTDARGITIAEDGTIFLAGKRGGLAAFTYTPKFPSIEEFPGPTFNETKWLIVGDWTLPL